VQYHRFYFGVRKTSISSLTQSLRYETWQEATTTHEKLYWHVEELKRTTTFITRAVLQV
jgi:hypothetical protein